MVTKAWGEVIAQGTVRKHSHTSLDGSTTESPSDAPLLKDMQLREQAGRIRCPCTVMLETGRWDHMGDSPEVKEAQGSWLIKVCHLRVQEWFTVMCRISKVWGRRLAWLSSSTKKKCSESGRSTVCLIGI